MKKGSLVLTDPNSDINYNIEGSPSTSITVPAMSLLVLYDFNNCWPYTVGAKSFAVWKQNSLGYTTDQPSNCIVESVPTEAVPEDESRSGYQIIDLSPLANASGSYLMTRYGDFYDVSPNSSYLVSSLGKWKLTYTYIYKDGAKIFSQEDIAAMKAGTNKIDPNYIIYNPSPDRYWHEFSTNMEFDGYYTELDSNTIIVIYLSAYSED